MVSTCQATLTTSCHKVHGTLNVTLHILSDNSAILCCERCPSRSATNACTEGSSDTDHAFCVLAKTRLGFGVSKQLKLTISWHTSKRALQRSKTFSKHWVLASHRRSTAHRSSRSRQDTAASATSGSCISSRSDASMWRLKSALNSNFLQHTKATFHHEWGVIIMCELSYQ